MTSDALYSDIFLPKTDPPHIFFVMRLIVQHCAAIMPYISKLLLLLYTVLRYRLWARV